MRVLSSKALPPPGTSLGEGCQALHATVEVVGVCLKKSNPKIQSGPEIFLSLHGSFPPGCIPAFCFSQLHLFCSNASLQMQKGLEERPVAVISFHLEKNSV